MISCVSVPRKVYVGIMKQNKKSRTFAFTVIAVNKKDENDGIEFTVEAFDRKNAWYTASEHIDTAFDGLYKIDRVYNCF